MACSCEMLAELSHQVTPPWAAPGSPLESQSPCTPPLPTPAGSCPWGPCGQRPPVLVILVRAPREPQGAEEMPARWVVSPACFSGLAHGTLQQGQDQKRPGASRGLGQADGPARGGGGPGCAGVPLHPVFPPHDAGGYGPGGRCEGGVPWASSALFLEERGGESPKWGGIILSDGISLCSLRPRPPTPCTLSPGGPEEHSRLCTPPLVG